MSPVDYLGSLGWLGDDVWFAHGIHFDDAGVAALAASGTGVAHCPSSNARLGAGVCRLRDLRRRACRSASAWTVRPATSVARWSRRSGAPCCSPAPAAARRR